MRSATSKDITLLAAYSQLQPFGSQRDDWHHARTQALLANNLQTQLYADGKLRQRKQYQPKDFMFRPKSSQAEKLKTLQAGLERHVRKQEKQEKQNKG